MLRVDIKIVTQTINKFKATAKKLNETYEWNKSNSKELTLESLLVKRKTRYNYKHMITKSDNPKVLKAIETFLE
jgi:hypothetical protein